MQADYHIHTPYCGHAEGTLIEYVEQAIAAGLSEIGFSDHLGRYYLSPSQKRRYWDWGMDAKNLERYVREVDDLKSAYMGRITIRTGLEVDYIEGAEEDFLATIKGLPFDFLLGSIHCLPTFSWRHIADIGNHGASQIFEEYFKACEAAIASRLFSSLAHVDFIWRYVRWPRSKSPGIFKRIEEVVQCAAHYGTALEINANAFLWSQLYKIRGGDPFECLCRHIHQYDIPITLGSDAHTPTHVGKNFEALEQQLAQWDVFKTVGFKNLQAYPLKKVSS